MDFYIFNSRVVSVYNNLLQLIYWSAEKYRKGLATSFAQYSMLKTNIN